MQTALVEAGCLDAGGAADVPATAAAVAAVGREALLVPFFWLLGVKGVGMDVVGDVG